MNCVSAIERLEQRNLFSFSVSQVGSVLTFTGGGPSESLAMSQSGSTLTITATGLGTNNYTGITQVNVNSMGGDDTITAASSVTTKLGVDGGSGADSLFGGSGNDTLVGGDGNDTINGATGLDSIYGSAGDDLLYGGSNSDQLFGGDDDDTLRGDNGADTIRGENGTDTVTVTTASKISLDDVANDGAYSGGVVTENDNVTSSNEYLIGSSGNDVFDASFVSFSVTLLGGDGNDVLGGGSAADLIDGGNGTDTLVASSGGDTVINIP